MAHRIEAPSGTRKQHRLHQRRSLGECIRSNAASGCGFTKMLWPPALLGPKRQLLGNERPFQQLRPKVCLWRTAEQAGCDFSDPSRHSERCRSRFRWGGKRQSIRCLGAYAAYLAAIRKRAAYGTDGSMSNARLCLPHAGTHLRPKPFGIGELAEKLRVVLDG